MYCWKLENIWKQNDIIYSPSQGFPSTKKWCIFQVFYYVRLRVLIVLVLPLRTLPCWRHQASCFVKCSASGFIWLLLCCSDITWCPVIQSNSDTDYVDQCRPHRMKGLVLHKAAPTLDSSRKYLGPTTLWPANYKFRVPTTSQVQYWTQRTHWKHNSLQVTVLIWKV